MKVLVLLCLICSAFAIEILVGEELAAPPSPPNITQQFIANYTLGDANDTSTQFYGFIAVDYIHGGGFLNFRGAVDIPIYIDTNFITSPSAEEDTITIYWFADEVCWNIGEASLDDVTLFPLKIPEGSTYLGTDTVQNQVCTVWSFDSVKFEANITIWVNAKLFNPVRIDLEDYGYVARWEFTDTTIGPFNPDIYAPPEGITCTNMSDPLLEFGSNPVVSHLLNVLNLE